MWRVAVTFTAARFKRWRRSSNIGTRWYIHAYCNLKSNKENLEAKNGKKGRRASSSMLRPSFYYGSHLV
jgi:hypothetical protein